MYRRLVPGLLCLTLIAATARAADFDPQPHLERPIIGPQLAIDEVKAFCHAHLMPIPQFNSSADWQKYADEVRERVLREVVFRGEAAEWRKHKVRIDWQETIEVHADYRLKKLRYEALPGLWIPAVLYEPTKLADKAPVFLNVNGHDSAGRAAGYKQTRCINQARRGILALNIEWFGMGQLKVPGNTHTRLNQLDLCGTSGVAPFFLAMHRGIDVLLSLPNADPERVGVAGLSGGGWQTIFISSLDPRVTLCNPVAGYTNFGTRIDHGSDLGDSEQTPVDLGANADYQLLTALLAPRAALLTFNSKDNCCFAAPHALPPLLDAARPVYRLFGKEHDLRWHVNHVPGNHNFGEENREALYRVIGDTFFPGDAKYPRHEFDCEKELKTGDELRVELPSDNLDLHSLAVKLSQSLPRQGDLPTDPATNEKWQAGARERLTRIVRRPEYRLVAAHEEPRSEEGVKVTSWRLRIGDAWTVPAVEFVPEGKSAEKTVVIVADAGRKSVAATVREHLVAGRRVLAVDPFYWGESKLDKYNWLWCLMLSTLGERPLGVQAEQLIAISRWAQATGGKAPVRLVTVGRKASVAGLVAAVLERQAISGLTTEEGLTSLKQVLAEDLTFQDQPELFCFGLLEEFDVANLIAAAGQGRVEVRKLAEQK